MTWTLIGTTNCCLCREAESTLRNFAILLTSSAWVLFYAPVRMAMKPRVPFTQYAPMARSRTVRDDVVGSTA